MSVTLVQKAMMVPVPLPGNRHNGAVDSLCMPADWSSDEDYADTEVH